MDKMVMINAYRKMSAADEYIVGYIYEHQIYFIVTPEIDDEYLAIEKASRNQGENLRLRMKSAQKKALMASNPVCLGSEDMLSAGKYNKGENFEKMVTEYFGQVWEKDTVPFWVQGDIRLNNKEVQIKLDSATLMNTKQMEKFAEVA